MKVYYKATKPFLSPALKRIEEGIILTLPKGYKMVETENEANLVIAPIVNWNDTKNIKPEKTVILQLCHKTAGGSEQEWFMFWEDSLRVFSYLDLDYHDQVRMPLGYDPKLFYNVNGERTYDALVTGYVDGPGGERIKEVVEAFDNVIHIGKNLNLDYHNKERISDAELRALYNQSKFVVALRDIEGFELPLIEGAACGCIPIFYDMECYYHWFENMGITVSTEGNLTENLRLAQITEPPPNIDVKRYQWKEVMKQFWDEIL